MCVCVFHRFVDSDISGKVGVVGDEDDGALVLLQGLRLGLLSDVLLGLWGLLEVLGRVIRGYCWMFY